MKFDELKRGDVFQADLTPGVFMRMSYLIPQDHGDDYPVSAVEVMTGLAYGTMRPDDAVTIVPLPNVPIVEVENYGPPPASVCDRRVTTEYPWDGSDGEGSIGESVVRYYCTDVEMVRAWRRAASDLAQSMARAADADARERGYGAIGSGRR